MINLLYKRNLSLNRNRVRIINKLQNLTKKFRHYTENKKKNHSRVTCESLASRLANSLAKISRVKWKLHCESSLRVTREWDFASETMYSAHPVFYKKRFYLTPSFWVFNQPTLFKLLNNLIKILMLNLYLLESLFKFHIF